MWQRFTETSRRAILRAEYEALQSQSPQVETEHLLLSLLTDTEDMGARVLTKAGITHRKVCAALGSQSGAGGLPEAWLNLDTEVEKLEKLSEEFRVDPALIRRIESQMLLKLREQSPKPELKLSAGLKRVLELASDEARQTQEALKRPCDIGTEHLLLGLLRDREGRASEILNTLGLNLEAARGSAIEFLRAQGNEVSGD